MLNRRDLTRNLIKIGSSLCVYINKSWEKGRCDCKYGLPTAPSRGNGEAFSGCCELRQVVSMLKAMTPTEWNRISKRRGRRK